MPRDIARFSLTQGKQAKLRGAGVSMKSFTRPARALWGIEAQTSFTTTVPPNSSAIAVADGA